MNFSDILNRLIAGESLGFDESREMMNALMGGQATDSQIAGLLVALRMKGETFEEIAGCAAAMQEKAAGRRIDRGPLIDTCGTGGHKAKLFNVSTVSAFVVAGAGGVVAKHGNRSNTSKCGSADALEALGVNLDQTPEQVADCVEKNGVGFLFAPKFHPAMKYVIGVRRELAVRTIFNLLGPLTNPFHADYQVLGVFSADLIETVAKALARMGRKRALVVHGDGGVCELSTIGLTRAALVENGEVKTYEWSPADFGLPEAAAEDLAGGEPKENAEIARQILIGEKGPRRDIVLLNAGAALYVAGMAETIKEGAAKAGQSIDSGAAMQKLEVLIAYSNQS